MKDCGIDLLPDMTFPSAHHSPNTVKRNAREFTIGTVRLSSSLEISICLGPNNRACRDPTSLPNQEEEPYTPSDVDQERDSIARPS